MLDRPNSHLLQQLDDLYGYRFGRYRQIYDPASHSDRHRVLMVNAITICSLRTVIVLSCIPCKYSTICQNRQVKVHCGMLNGRDQAEMLKYGKPFGFLFSISRYRELFPDIGNSNSRYREINFRYREMVDFPISGNDFRISGIDFPISGNVLDFPISGNQFPISENRHPTEAGHSAILQHRLTMTELSVLVQEMASMMPIFKKQNANQIIQSAYGYVWRCIRVYLQMLLFSS